MFIFVATLVDVEQTVSSLTQTLTENNIVLDRDSQLTSQPVKLLKYHAVRRTSL